MLAPITEKGYVNIYGRDITERKRAEQELAAAKDRMASDLDAMARLHKISTKFVSQGDIRTMLDEIVETAIAITHADMGNIQLFDAQVGKSQDHGAPRLRAAIPGLLEHGPQRPGHLRHSARARGARDRR